MHLLITRPFPHGERTAAALQQLGHHALLAPLLSIETLAEADLGTGDYAGIVITSANAAGALADHALAPALRRLPVFTVGSRTAEAARLAGFADVQSANGDMNDLVELVAQRNPGPLLYAAGEERAGDFARALALRDVPVHIVELYRAVTAVTFPDDARSAIAGGKLDGVLHFSRRSAAAFRTCITAAGLIERARILNHYCLSQQVAEPLEQLAGPGRIKVAPQPNEASLLGLLGQS